MVDDFGGTDSDQGNYGPVGPTSTAPNPNQGPVGPVGPPGPNIDRWAATRIVSQNPDEGTDLTIQDAIDNLPAEGGTIFIKNGTYSISTTLLLPDKDIDLVVAAGTVIAPVGDIALFKVVDGLTALRAYKIYGQPVLTGDPSKNQTLIALDDANGRGTVEFWNARFEGFATLVDWLKYDENYENQSLVIFHDSFGKAIPGDSVLAKTPQAAGSYFAGVMIQLDNTLLQGDRDEANVYATWSGDADMDLLLQRNSWLQIDVGSSFDGCNIHDSFVFFVGTGDVTWYGYAWVVPDSIGGGTGFSVLSDDGTGNPSDVRLVFAWHIDISVNFALTSFNLGNGSNFIKSRISIRDFEDLIGFAHPGIEIGSKGIVCHTAFLGNGRFPNGCVRLFNDAVNAKVHDCDFASSVLAKVIAETTGCNKNIFHDNTGYASGTGVTIVGADTVQHDNIN